MNNTRRYLAQAGLILLSFCFGASLNYLVNHHPVTSAIIYQGAELVVEGFRGV